MSDKSTKSKPETAENLTIGVVSSNKMDKTIVVLVSTKLLHEKYKKYINKIVKYKVHDEKNEAKIGDVVSIVSTRKYSKTKAYKLHAIVKQNIL